MSKLLESVPPKEPQQQQVLIYTMTPIERQLFPRLVSYGEQIMRAVVARAPEQVAGYVAQLDAVLASSADAGAEQAAAEKPRALTVPEIQRVLATASMDRSELVMRALAFLGGMDAEVFRKRVHGCRLDFNVTDPMMPCPSCPRLSACKRCGGGKVVPSEVTPEHRLHTPEEIRDLSRGTMAPPLVVMPGGKAS